MTNYLGRRARYRQDAEEALDFEGKPTGEWTEEQVYEGEVREQGWLDENHTWNLLSMYEEGGLVQEHDEALYDGWDEKDIPRENTPDLYIYNDQEKQPWICVKFDEIEFLET